METTHDTPTCCYARCEQTPARLLAFISTVVPGKGFVAGYCAEHVPVALATLAGVDVTEGTSPAILTAAGLMVEA